MLDPGDRSMFMDVLVALFRKFEVGEIRMEFSWREFPGNPVRNAVHHSLCSSMRPISFPHALNC